MLHMSSIAVAGTAGLRRIPPESWGSLLTRARKTSPIKITQERAAFWIEQVTSRPIDPATVGRLESLERPPADRARRRNAYLLSILYEIDPTELDLGPNDGPDELEVRRLRNAISAIATLGYRGAVAIPLVAA